MKRFVLWLFAIACLSIPSFAVRRVSLSQFDQVVSSLQGKPDSDAAWQLGDVRLTERLNPEHLSRVQAAVPGEKSREVLLAISDASQFCPPPPDELPATPAPDVAAQRQIMGRVAAYVTQAIPRLPNFFATRNTSLFEEVPPMTDVLSKYVPYQPLHPSGTLRSTAVYRAGREDSASDRKQPLSQGLTTWGVFGPILSTVLLDAAHSTLVWSRWDRDATHPQEAVFSYSVPRRNSHYEVNYCCVAAQAGTYAANMYPYRALVGYHGTMTVDPATGTILRLILQADLKTGDPIVQADILVDYGPVTLGGTAYICPLRSISLARAQVVQRDPTYKYAVANQLQPLRDSLSQTTFDDYHLFRAEARILPPGADNPPASPDAAATAVSQPGTPASSPPAPSASVASTTPGPPPPTPIPNPPQPSENTGIASPADDAAIAIREEPGADLPDTGPSTPQLALRTTSRLVEVALIATDRKGRPLTDLQPSDLEVYDDGRRQNVRFFSSPAEPVPSAQSKPSNPSRQPSSTPTGLSPRAAPAQHLASPTILMIDSGNLARADLSYARSETLRFLKSLRDNDPVGIYVLHPSGFAVLAEPTTDHARLEKLLSAWMPTAQDLSHAQEEEQRNHQHFDWVAHATDLVFVNGNDSTDPESSGTGRTRAALSMHGPDPKLRFMGSAPERDALLGLEVVAHHLAAIPGHKSLVWISSDNALADWSSQAAAREDEGPKNLDPVSIAARETLNDAGVTLYPLDASQLEASVITADLQNRLIEARIPAPVQTSAPPPPNPTGRAAAQMHQDTHTIQGMFQDLADATGGRALRKSSDIAHELQTIDDDGRSTYSLGFTPDTQPDGQYHIITIKPVSRRNITLHYRTGYLYDKEPSSVKERFHRLVWSSRDASEISIQAHLDPAGDPAGHQPTQRTLQLTIAAADLSLEELEGLWLDSLDIFTIQRDDSALQAKIDAKTLRLRLHADTHARVLKDGVPFQASISLPAPGKSVRLIVVDGNSGRMGSLTLTGDDPALQ